MGSSASAASDNLKSMPKGIKDDIRMGLTNKFESEDQERDYLARTTVSAAAAQNYGSDSDDNPAPRRSTMARAAAPSYSVGGVGSAPALPDPDAVGETEKALLNANKKGQSAMIATSPAGLLAGDDSTRKKRSLMGGLIR